MVTGKADLGAAILDGGDEINDCGGAEVGTCLARHIESFMVHLAVMHKNPVLMTSINK